MREGPSPAKSRPRVAAVVPARNEGARISATLAALRRLPLQEIKDLRKVEK